MNISICHSNGIGPAGPDPAYTISMLINVVFRFLSARKNPEKSCSASAIRLPTANKAILEQVHETSSNEQTFIISS